MLLKSTALCRHGGLSPIQVALHHPRVGCRVRVTPNCRAARLAGRTGAVVGLGRQVELKLDGDDHQLSKVNRNEAPLLR